MRVGIHLGLLLPTLASAVLATFGGACLDGQCNDEIAGCDTALAQRCHPEEAKAQACLTNADGCLVWTDTAICGPHDKCSADEGAPMCECDHGCEPQTSQCMAAVVQVCDLDEYGCLFWKNHTDCSLGGSTCTQEGGQASCGGCVDTCQAFGQSQCNGAVVQTCTNSGDGCLIWQDGSDCGATGQSCDDSGSTAVCSGACTNLCDYAGQGRCDGTRIEVCTTDAAGCLRWETGADCGLTGQRCEVDGGVAACVTDACVDTCAPEHESHCNGSAVEVCTRGSDGCLHWTPGIDCDGTGQTCDDSSGSATCVGACSDGCTPASSTRCQGDVIQTCTLGGGGCLAWLQTANCASSGATCVDAGGSAECQPTGGEIALCGLCNQDDQCAGHTGALGGTYCQPLSEQAEYWYCLQDCTNDEDLCQPGETCDGNGNCIPPNGCGVTVCTSYNPTGACPPGLQCIGGECRDPSACSSTNTSGSCPAGLTCVAGVCEQTATGNMPVGGPCEGDEHCADSGAICYPEVIDNEDTGFLDGYCMVFECTAASCPAGSTCVSLGESSICMDNCAHNSDCRDGSLCYSVSSGGVCWRGCTDSSCPEGNACIDDICQRIECTTGDDCDQGENCVGGRCILDVANGPGQNPQSLDAALAACNLPPLECSDGRTACGELIRFDPTYGTGYADYPENGETADDQYRSWLRRDNVMMIKYATAYVDCLAANWAGHHEPLGLIDMSEQNGDIPGTSDRYCVDDTYRYNECQTQADCAAGRECVSSPGHPNGTHEGGHDIDVAYYQTQYTDNRARPICTHTDSNGRDAYHCTAPPDNLDPWRSALFLGALFEHPALRIIGCDGQAGQILDSAIARLCQDGWIKPSACSNDRLTYEVTDGGSGWYLFHHHHMHVSLGTPSYPYSALPGRDELCLVPGCGPTLLDNYLNQQINKPRPGLPQLSDLPPALLQP